MSRTMPPLLRTGIIIAALMFVAAALAVVMRPSHKIADQGPKIDLETMIPHEFGSWREEVLSKALIVDPQQQEMLNTIYSQLLSRSYRNEQGYRIMLSIAYGNDQSDSMQVHKPEICYPAQGFVLENKTAASLAFGQSAIPVTRIATSLGQRREPVTYWTTIGDQTVKSGIHKKLVEISYGLTGKIPDGMLIRVSSIDPDTSKAYLMQAQFAQDLLAAMAPDARKRLTGTLEEN